jgi:hypothetical protein
LVADGHLTDIPKNLFIDEWSALDLDLSYSWLNSIIKRFGLQALAIRTLKLLHQKMYTSLLAQSLGSLKDTFSSLAEHTMD